MPERPVDSKFLVLDPLLTVDVVGSRDATSIDPANSVYVTKH